MLGTLIDNLAAAIIAADSLPEWQADNVLALHNVRDPQDLDDQNRETLARHDGLALYIYDGGSSNPDADASDSLALTQTVALEVFVDPYQRDLDDRPELKAGHLILSDLMAFIHGLRIQPTAQHCYDAFRVSGHQTAQDPEFVVWSITAERPLVLG